MSARQTAIDQVELLLAYLRTTPAVALDAQFIRHHLAVIQDFVLAAKTEAMLPSQREAHPYRGSTPTS
ncbi:MAG TPA: hypothetical protein VNJ09_10550 [Chthonomonadales bacterium]|nr:hypothetical protein [Chthonomonadales bacterium]